MNKFFHTLTVKEALLELNSSLAGLSTSEAAKRLQEVGPNALPEPASEHLFLIFLRQFRSPLIYVLLVAAVIVFLLQDLVDAGAIVFILLFNAAIGTFQEGRAQNTLAALRKFIQTKTLLIRDGKEEILDSEELVPGDIIILKEGEKVPADARIISSNELKINESSLTGESNPVYKTESVLDNTNLPIADQTNMVFKGTFVSSGEGKALVVATGINTAIGKISREIATVDTEMPLKGDIDKLSRIIITVVLTISALIFAVGLLLDKPVKEMFFTVVALAVSVVPEGLPVVLTLVLSTGVWRMAKRNALVKRLMAVEALGQAQIIAVDKTGTITHNEMMVQRVYCGGEHFTITGEGYSDKGEVQRGGKKVEIPSYPLLLNLARISALSPNASIHQKEGSDPEISGDPTEAAIITFAKKMGIEKAALLNEFKELSRETFKSETRYLTASFENNKKNFTYILGAPEVILDKCVWFMTADSKLIPIAQKRNEVEDVIKEASSQGMRLVAVSSNEAFIGLFEIQDSIRPEAKEAVQAAQKAGLKVVMITGDHKETAKAIAKQAGIYLDGDTILTGEEIEKLSEAELDKKILSVSVFARVTPEHKLRIVQSYKRSGNIIGMTGDGVNDAPALVAADLGIAMGKVGTEVAKEAADIILLDDNFRSIVAAIEEGRAIYKTIKKVILYLFSTGSGELLIITMALIAGWPLPLLPIQILWVNLVGDGILSTPLALEPKEKDLLEQKWQRSDRNFIDLPAVRRLGLMSLIMTAGTLFVFGLNFRDDLTHALTLSFTTLAVFQWFNAWNCRSETKSVFSSHLWSNKTIIFATLVVFCLQLLAIYAPFMQNILHTVPLSLADWVLIFATASSILLLEEIRKFIYRRRRSS